MIATLAKPFYIFRDAPALLYKLMKHETQMLSYFFIRTVLNGTFLYHISRHYSKLTIMALTISQSLFFKALTAYEIILKDNIFNVMINKRGVNVVVNIFDIILCGAYDIIHHHSILSWNSMLYT